MSQGLRIVLLLLAASLAGGIVTGNSIYYRLSYVWIGLILFSWLMSRVSLAGVQLERTSRTMRSQVGQIFEERFEIKNNSRWPVLWMEIRDLSNLTGARGSHVLALIGARESRTYISRTRLVERGVFPLGPTVLISGDVFGLFPNNRTFDVKDSILVLPHMFEIQNFPNPPGLLPGGEALRRRTAQITSNAAGVREYAPGDPLNRIHWVSTARRDRLIVKEFELDPLAEVWIFLDASRTVQASKPFEYPEFDPREIWRSRSVFNLPPSTIEYSITLAASLARYYLQRSRAVGLVTASTAVQIIPADRGSRQLNKILEALSLVKPETSLPLHSLVEVQARNLPRGSTTLLITPSTSEMVFRSSDLLLRRGMHPIILLLDAISFGGFFSPEKLEEQLRFMKFPVTRITEGEDLPAAISSIVTFQGAID